MNECIASSVELPHSTAECDTGPEILFKPGSLTVRYDYDSDIGESWGKMVFLGAIAQRFIPDIVTTELMTNCYSKICVIENSSWIAELEDRTDSEIFSSLKHFMVYFDHNGCLEVLAREFSLE